MEQPCQLEDLARTCGTYVSTLVYGLTTLASEARSSQTYFPGCRRLERVTWANSTDRNAAWTGY